ncbi:MAG: hypothetical protein ACLGIA_09640 [Actinomycetes bacterium]
MTYSLADVPALGFDLVRLPRGPDVARVLVLALRAGPTDLQRLAAHHPGPVRRARWQRARAAATRENAVEAARVAWRAQSIAPEQRVSGRLVERLERAPLGDLDDVDRLVRHGVLDWTWREGQASQEGKAPWEERDDADLVATQPSASVRAADVLVDAAAAGFCETLPSALRRELRAPFDSATGMGTGERHPVEPDRLEARHVVPLLARLRAAAADERDAWRRVCGPQSATRDDWATAMRDAGWALDVSERVRACAACQLEAVVAFREAGFSARDASWGVWDAVAGVVQAHVVADLLSDDARRVLLEPWLRVYGSEPQS